MVHSTNATFRKYLAVFGECQLVENSGKLVVLEHDILLTF